MHDSIEGVKTTCWLMWILELVLCNFKSMLVYN